MLMAYQQVFRCGCGDDVAAKEVSLGLGVGRGRWRGAVRVVGVVDGWGGCEGVGAGGGE